MTTSPHTLRAGDRLGRFVLDRRMGVGGMAEIWIARDGDGRRPVALKIVQPHLIHDREFQAMFVDEVNIALRLRHENIVRVHDGRLEDGHLFLVMDLVEGLDLRRALVKATRQREWIPTPIALGIGQCMVRGLSYAHLRRDDRGRSLDIIHRDISPHNVMLGVDGSVQLLDFGIARARERYARTRPGVVKGKAGYMAPEQALGIELDQRTDIFATGVVLWETLAMKRLFGGSKEVEAMHQVVQAKVPPITDINPTVPPDAADLIHRMLARSPRDRPSTMHDVERALTRILVRAYPAEAFSRHRRAAWMASMLARAPLRGATLSSEPDTSTDNVQTEPHHPTEPG